MKAIILASLFVLSVACGQVPGRPTAAVASPSPSSVATPASSSSALLFAVLEAKGTANAWTYNTVAIAGLDGNARAKTTFTPMLVPTIGCMGAVIPQSAHVANGKVFFADEKGVVRSLAINGTVAIAATFPLNSAHQMLSFAVSPDGTIVLGTIYTLPSGISYCNGAPSGTFNFDAYRATAGGAAQLVYHDSWSTSHNVLALTGWDSVGPIGTYPTIWASQGGGPGSTLGVKVRVDATTIRPGSALSDPTACIVWDTIASAAFVCTKNGVIAQQQVTVPVSIRRADGAESWQFTIAGMNGPSSPYLNPDGTHVIMCCSDDSHEWLIGRDGSRIKLGTAFYGSGWLDASTVIGEYHPDPLQQPPLTLSYVTLSAPGTVVPMGFAGLFVGTVRA
jgi:hypothetical protein